MLFHSNVVVISKQHSTSNKKRNWHQKSNTNLFHSWLNFHLITATFLNPLPMPSAAPVNAPAIPPNKPPDSSQKLNLFKNQLKFSKQCISQSSLCFITMSQSFQSFANCISGSSAQTSGSS